MRLVAATALAAATVLLAPAWAQTQAQTQTQAPARTTAAAPPSVPAPGATAATAPDPLRAACGEIPDAEHLTLERVIASTLDNHPRVRRAELAAEAARARTTAARGAFDPTLGADGRQMLAGTYRDREGLVSVDSQTPWAGLRVGAQYRYHAGDIPDYYGYRETGSAGELMARAELPLLEGRRTDPARTALAIANQHAEVAELELLFEQLDVARQAALAWWSWKMALEILVIRADLLAIADERVDMVGAQVASGAMAPIEDVEARRTRLQRQSLLVEALRDVDLTAAELSFWLRSTDGARRSPDPCDRPDWPDASRTHHQLTQLLRAGGADGLSRPDIARLEPLREVARAREALAVNRILPVLDVRGWAASQLGTDLPRPDRVDAGVGLRFALPLGNRAARGERDAASAEADRITFEQRLLIDAMERDLEIAIARLNRALERLTLVSDEVATLRTLEAAERIAWQSGESTLFVVNLRELATAEARELEVRALRDVFQSAIDLRATRGDAPETWANPLAPNTERGDGLTPGYGVPTRQPEQQPEQQPEPPQ